MPVFLPFGLAENVTLMVLRQPFVIQTS